MKADLPEFSAAWDKGENFCATQNERYSDWKTPPTAEDSEEMCLPCPMYMACRANALHQKHAWGTWGGISWVMGQQAHLLGDAELAVLLSED